MGLIEKKPYWQLDRVTGRFKKVKPQPEEMAVKQYYQKKKALKAPLNERGN